MKNESVLFLNQEQRSKYDIEVARQQDAQTALNQFSVLLTELQEKIVRASNTIR